jgi:tRNA pseudouridine55 synthase
MDGLLVINKPGGMTSHDVVDRLRAILRERRIGHTGTLDPDATGVLVLAVGRATRIIPFLPLDEKEYEAGIRLGISTDTHDASGAPEGQDRSNKMPDEERLRDALQRFCGEIRQVPPMVSALKVGGQRLYRLARQGIDVARKPRRVTIKQIELLDYQPPLARLRLVCSAGTYIRSLARDLGELLETGAHLADLVRLRVGPYHLDKALPEEDWERLANADFRMKNVITPEQALDHLPSWTAGEKLGRRLTNGQRISPTKEADGFPVVPDGLIAVLSQSGNLIAVARKTGEPSGKMSVSPVRVFMPDNRVRAG